MKNKLLLLTIFILISVSLSYSQSKKSQKNTKSIVAAKDTSIGAASPLVTFIELGSVNCIPCKAMQPVMKSVEEKYGSQLKVIFYDVWTDEGKPFGSQYSIRLIPTQVFLDKHGKELMRHEGFFPEKKIDAFLRSKGLKPKSVGKG